MVGALLGLWRRGRSKLFRDGGRSVVGRAEFDASDRPGNPRVILINKEAADRYWPNGDFVGKRIRPVRFKKGDWLTVVGVVGGVHFFGLDQPPPPTLYYSSTQWAGPTTGLRYSSGRRVLQVI